MGEMRAVLLCIAGALVCAVLKMQRPELRMVVAIAVGLVAVSLSLDGIRSGVESIAALSREAGLGKESGPVLLRAVGIAVIAEFGAQLCRDADESSLAGRVELAGRAALLGMTAPLLAGLMSRIADILP